ncbi:FecR family protein [Niabella aurantiaca]|uniref:FecR family protein n=1 Tax=Niabella aurantiaca TaxID=379900 RepID=UPI000372BD24|nr:FecR family protein [Niabella aurantiaca]
MKSEFYKELVDRYLEKKLGEEELEVFFHLLDEGKLDAYLFESMETVIRKKEEKPSVVSLKRRPYHYLYRVAAAVVILALGIGLFRYYARPAQEASPAIVKTAPVVPGGNNAVLTLGDGKRIILNRVPDGTLEQGTSFSVRKEKDGLVVFDVNGTAAAEIPQDINKIETPKGGIYQVILPDGSLVWLNNASSIAFPTRFAKNERRVTITGEAYFEVKHDKTRPFRVLSNGQEVEVLGTKFNVNAYRDEAAVRTTLLEGSVQVRAGQSTGLLKPGFQSVLKGPGSIVIRPADLESVMAWKEGFFQFDRADIPTLMRQLARWYDIDIKYTGAVPKDEFVGKIKRSEDIHKVLDILRYGKVKFRLEGRTLIVE